MGEPLSRLRSPTSAVQLAHRITRPLRLSLFYGRPYFNPLAQLFHLLLAEEALSVERTYSFFCSSRTPANALLPVVTKPLVDAYTHCPLCGSPDYASQQDGTRHCRACDHRDFNNPITAVAALILDPQDRLLLIRRAKDPAKGLLAMPGGFVDPGESLEQAIHREIAEEIGLALTGIRYLCSHPNDYTYRGLTRPVCDVFFQARATSFNVVLQREEVADWQLRPLGEIAPAELAFDSMRHALATLRARP